ncbi:alpha/beta hydrolase family protein [Spirosoma oryzae]|uniref:Alpha/beta hydrolase family protein n=1 Tax=Spirosoma oryzae TaxID=1469603 RepID=A0A2T0S555_9BACT|nr:alpha/beta hydrolase [Spirosoma oryzae]PRY28558.1 alpha/beta hydrolase family protein [Spirosoma oryzae]
MKRIYIFSGLGADERVFQYLDFSGFTVTFIRWLQPLQNETIEEYAKRLTQQITTVRPILIGLSFGGIVATEVAKLIDTEKIILVASAKTRQEIPFYYRLAGRLRLHKLLPVDLLKRPNALSNWFFGVCSQSDKKMLATILRDTDGQFLWWAIDKIITWKNQLVHSNSIHIHGTADRILPIRYVVSDRQVDGGGHFMTVNKAKELTAAIRSLL